MIEMWFDGACEPINLSSYGAYGLYILRDGNEILKEGHFIGRGLGISNNVAEYSGFIRGLEYLKAHNLTEEHIIIRGDSKLVIEQMKGNWRIKQGIYVSIALNAKKLVKQFKNINFIWIPREENIVCDSLGKNELEKLKMKFRMSD